MKKSLLALAVLGAFAATASAQSSVTIYGLLDLAVTKGNGGTAPNPGANGTSEAYIMKQSASSRLGFRGNEDMGGGLSAQFQIEHRFTPDDGAAAAPFWAGRSWLGLTFKPAGQVYLGREYGPAFWPAVKSDPFGWDGVGQISTMQYAGFANTNGGSSVRTSNTAGFKSANFGGVTFQGAVGLDEGANVGRNDGLNVEYAGGPLYVGVGYERISGGPVATDGNKLMNLAVHWDFGFLKLMGYYGNGKVTGGTVSNKAVQLGARAPIGPGVLKAAVARLDPQGNDNTVTKIGLGYDYFLSKRTNVYADFGQAKSDVVGVTNNRAFALGVKHVF
jgi:predicted porin